MIRTYRIREIAPLINWTYFLHAWGFKRSTSAHSPQAKELLEEAANMLDLLDSKGYAIQSTYRLCQANSDGDDLLLEGSTRIPLLRQQTRKHADAPFLCLSDFVRPLGTGIPDTAGAFATSVDCRIEHLYPDDPYRHILAQTLADRLAEAATEKMHTALQQEYGFRGIRPAVGYPCLPDQSINFILDRWLGMDKIGIGLTESGAMSPHASVSGLIITHPQAHYFAVGEIKEDQLRDYAVRRGMDIGEVKRFIGMRYEATKVGQPMVAEECKDH